MRQLKINYPVISFNTITVEVSDERAEEIADYSLSAKAAFIIDEDDKAKTGEMMFGLKDLEAALEMGYATIKPL